MSKEMIHRESGRSLGGGNVELDLDPKRFVAAVQIGFATPLESRPSITQTWHPKTDNLLTSRWKSLSPTHRRIASVLVEIGKSYPDCASIESMTRITIQSKDTTVEQIARIFELFQDRARRMGNSMIMERASAMTSLALFIPDINLKTGSDIDIMTALLKFMPVAIYASIGNKQRTREEYEAAPILQGAISTAKWKEQKKREEERTDQRKNQRNWVAAAEEDRLRNRTPLEIELEEMRKRATSPAASREFARRLAPDLNDEELRKLFPD